MYRSGFISILVVITLLSTAGVIHADQPRFRVDSFIPQKFTDLEIKLDGAIQNRGYGYDSDHAQPDMNGNSQSDDNLQRIEIGGTLVKKYETIPRFYEYRCHLASSFLNQNRDEESNMSYDGANSRMTKNESSGYEFDFSLENSIDAGAYMLKDFFLSGQVDLKAYYIKSPEDKISIYSYRRDDQIDEYYDYTIGLDRETSKDTKRYYVDLEFLPGWGRLYEGNFASTALYMIDELKRNGYLEKEPDYDQMMQLTEIIYQYNQKHVIDSRVRRIEALTAISEYLKNQNLTGGLNPSGQVIMQDVWDYFPRNSRKFGYRFRLGPTYSYYHWSDHSDIKESSLELDTHIDPYFHPLVDTLLLVENKSDYSNHQTNSYQKADLTFMFEYHRPLGLRWQFDGRANYTTCLKYENDIKEENTNNLSDYSTVYTERNIKIHDRYEADLSATATYIANSRTLLSMTGNYSIYHYRKTEVRKNDNIFLWERKDPSITQEGLFLRGSLEYRIAIPTTLTVNATYELNSVEQPAADDYSDSDRSIYVFDIRIEHYLF